MLVCLIGQVGSGVLKLVVFACLRHYQCILRSPYSVLLLGTVLGGRSPKRTPREDQLRVGHLGALQIQLTIYVKFNYLKLKHPEIQLILLDIMA